MQQKKLVIVLADISGYTQFMLDNRTSALHGQICINSLIESILAQVDIPLTVQELEGDAVFLYAADPGDAEGWQRVLEEVSHKLTRFFDVFIAQAGFAIESTPCGCAICRNADQLGLKIIVHAGEAVFHEVSGRAQVSGPDVILAHRLLKNSLSSKEYLMLTEQAYDLMGANLSGRFEQHREQYPGFDTVPLRVRFLEEDFLKARDAVYELNESQMRSAVSRYMDAGTGRLLKAALQQMRHPVRAFGWLQKLLMLGQALLETPAFRLYYRNAIARQQRAKGKRQTG